MGRFKIKDLMVDVVKLDRDPIDAGDIVGYQCKKYGYPSFCIYLASQFDWDSICHRVHTTEIFEVIEVCHAGSVIPVTPITPVIYEQWWEVNPSEIAALREQYKEAVKQIDLAEKRTAKELSPRTVEEIEVLESQFTEALKELAVLKKGMK